jgi:hypothetical protein
LKNLQIYTQSIQEPWPQGKKATLVELAATDEKETLAEVDVVKADSADFAGTKPETKQCPEYQCVSGASMGKEGDVRQSARAIQYSLDLVIREDERTPQLTFSTEAEMGRIPFEDPKTHSVVEKLLRDLSLRVPGSGVRVGVAFEPLVNNYRRDLSFK